MWKLCKLLKTIRHSKSLCGVPQAKTVFTNDKASDEEDEKDKTLTTFSNSVGNGRPAYSNIMAQLQNSSNFSSNCTTTKHFSNVFNVLITASAFAYLVQNPSSVAEVQPISKKAVHFNNPECSTQTVSDQTTTNFDLSKTEVSTNLATTYDHMIGSFKNTIGLSLLKQKLYTEAYEHFKQAARLYHHPSATYNLGMCFYKGYGVGRDEREAVKLWKVAADAGHDMAKYQTAVCHLRAIGCAVKDKKLACQYLQSAVSSDKSPMVEAYTLYGALLYKAGEMEQAGIYLKKAQDLSSPVAAQLLLKLKESKSHTHPLTS